MKIHLCLYLLDNSTHALSNQIILIIHQLALHNQSITNTLPLAEIINENISVKHVTNCLAAKITLYVCERKSLRGPTKESESWKAHLWWWGNENQIESQTKQNTHDSLTLIKDDLWQTPQEILYHSCSTVSQHKCMHPSATWPQNMPRRLHHLCNCNH